MGTCEANKNQKGKKKHVNAKKNTNLEKILKVCSDYKIKNKTLLRRRMEILNCESLDFIWGDLKHLSSQFFLAFFFLQNIFNHKLLMNLKNFITELTIMNSEFKISYKFCQYLL